MSAKIRFVEISPSVLPFVYPDIARGIPPHFLDDISHDPNYVIRVSADGSYAEFGYPDDRWLLK